MKTKCIDCAKIFQSKGFATLCFQCRYQKSRDARMANSQLRRQRTCKQCGCQFRQGNLSSTQIAAEHRQEFCSRKCRWAAHRKYASKSEAKRAYKIKKGRFVSEDRTCLGCGESFKAKRREKIYCTQECKLNYTREPKTCLICSKAFPPIYGHYHNKICSDKCRKLNYIAQRQKYKIIRARKMEAEEVIPEKVFERDKWQCQLCKQQTSKYQRGLTQPLAPELDHVIPLSRGGRHSYSNTQCLCRACNNIKGDKLMHEIDMTTLELKWENFYYKFILSQQKKISVRDNGHAQIIS